MECAAAAAPILEAYQFAGPVFLNAFQTFLTAQCLLVGDHLWPADAVEAVQGDPQFDFIVIGAGSAGSVVANRLTEEASWRVLLIEAGGNPTMVTESPQLYNANMGTSIDWAYRTQTQDNVCLSYTTKSCYWPRGKTLGGSSAINANFYVRGNKLDYDEWALDGSTGWSYDDVLPYFKKAENYSGDLTAEAENYHGFGGYLHIERGADNETEQILLKAYGELGVKTIYDCNGEDQMGTTVAFSTSAQGRRMSTAKAFLTPIKDRSNLSVLKNAYATKLIFKDNTTHVIGVEVKKDGEVLNIYADKEVIVSAGTVNTPQLLLLSGIGPQNHLQEKGIEVKLNSPVGENLQDHLLIPVFFKTDQIEMPTELSDIASNMFQFILNSSGVYSGTTPSSVITFVNLTDLAATSPEIQYHNFFMGQNSSNVIEVFRRHGYTDEFQNLYNDMNTENIILTIFTALLHPKSRGTIKLNSSDPEDHPLIYANYLAHDEDLKTTLEGVKFAAQLENTQAFKDVGLELALLDLDACKEYVKKSDDHIKCWIREASMSFYHPVGTSKMGPESDETAVVDPDLKVIGTEGLRVIDASVMRTIVRGNTNAPTIMIAEKGSDIIKKQYLGK